MRSSLRPRVPVLLALLFPGVGILACDGGALTGPDPEIEPIGRVERGLEIELRVSRDGIEVPAGEVDFSADPAASVQFLGNGRALLVEAGQVTITARADGRSTPLDLDVPPPPTIVFDRRVAGNRDVYRAALDGRDVVRLTTSTGDELQPTAAGGVIVFVSFRDGNAELYRVPLAGGADERLTVTPASETDPALSRDGARLAYTSDVTGTPRLWLAGPDATMAIWATEGLGFGGSIEASPGWSPTGDRVVFVATHQGSADLFTLRVADLTFERLTIETTAEVEPSWSPEGQSIVFASNRDGPTNLYVANGQISRLTTSPDTHGQPAWLPDGRIVFTTFVDGVPRLSWLDPAEPERIHQVPGGDGGANPAAAP